MNNRFRFILVLILLISNFSFCFSEAEIEVTYDSVGDSSVFTYILEDIIVNAKYERTTENIDQVITERQILVKQPLNVADALKTSPDINASTGTKGETNTKIRGFSSEDILVLIDGRPINPGYYGKVDLSMIPTDNIAKIKVLKGPASVSYGTNNTGGVINIITKNGQEKPQTKVSGMFGDQEFQRININHSYKYESMNYWISGYYQHMNGYKLSEDFIPTSFEDGGVRNNSFYEKWGTDAKISYTPSADAVYSLSLGYHSAEKEVPYSIYIFVPQRYFIFPEWYRYQASLTGYRVLNKKADIKGVVSFDSYQDRLLSYKNAEFDDNDLDFDSWLKNYTFGTLWSGSYVINNSNEITYGLNTLRYFLKKGYAGEDWLQRETQTGNIYTDYLLKLNDATNFNAGIALNSFYKDNDSSLDNYIGYSLSADRELGYGFNIIAGFAQTQRFPTMHQLYSTDSGNEDLNPEECLKYELVIKKGHEFLDYHVKASVETSVFLNDLKNMIEKQTATDQYANSDAKIAGIEVSSSINYGEYISADLGYSHLKPYDFGVEMLYESPRNKMNAGLKLKYYKFMIDYNFIYNDARETEYTRILPSYTLHTVNFHYNLLQNLEFQVKAENIFDTHYEEEVGFPAPGRMITAGFTFTI